MCVPHVGYTQNSESHSLTAPLREKPILNLGKLRRMRTFLVVVSHVVDPSAHGIAPHARGIVGPQQFGRRCHIPHSRIKTTNRNRLDRG
jgi:hypothetical protein